MKHLIESVRAAVREKNWYAALSVALALPDICAKVEDTMPAGSQKRYINWFDKYLAPNYQRMVAGQVHTFLTGDDCYALRCAYSHEGEFDISGQRARKALASYVFVATPPGVTVHMKQTNSILQLQTNLFCEEICLAVETWMAAVAGVPGAHSRIAALPKIVLWAPGSGI
jgi:hypothetical protein